MNRTPMQVSVEEIAIASKTFIEFSAALLKGHGYSIRLDQPNYDRLVIEVVGVNRVSVAHYFEQNGDLMSDPEIVFQIFYPNGWFPVQITQSPVGRFREASEGKYLPGVISLARMWGKNIRDQGWVEVAKSAKPTRDGRWETPRATE